MTHDFRCHRMLGLDRLARALDTRMLSFAMTLVLVALLIVFYTVTMVNMSAISGRIDEINAHPYPVTVPQARWKPTWCSCALCRTDSCT